jgi:hypothetical protein
MTFTSIASKNTRSLSDSQFQITKFSKISVAASLASILGLTFLQALLWMPASHPAELTAAQKQAQATATVK